MSQLIIRNYSKNVLTNKFFYFIDVLKIEDYLNEISKFKYRKSYFVDSKFVDYLALMYLKYNDDDCD